MDDLDLSDLEPTNAIPDEAPTPDPEAPKPTEGVSAEPEPAPTPTTDTASASPEAPAAPPTTESEPITPPWTPPTGDPFRFKVDGTEITPTGAMHTPDGGVYFPPGVWDKEVRERYLGNRDVWRQTEQQYRQRIAQAEEQVKAADPGNNPVVAGARKVMDFLMQGDPDKVIEWLDNRRTNLPLMMAQAEKDMLKQQLTQREQSEQQQRMEQERAAAETQLASFLQQQVTTALQEPGLKVLGENPEEAAELIQDMQDRHGIDVLAAVAPEQASALAGQGWQLLGQAAGKAILFHPRQFREILEKRAEKAVQWRQRVATVTKAEKRNQAALTPPPPVPPPPKPRDEAGRFTEPKTMDPKAARAILDDLTLDDVMSR